MAVMNYGLVVNNSNFLPYTFKDIIEPFLLYKQDYEKESEKIEKYGTDFATFTLPENAAKEYRDTLSLFREKFNNAVETFTNEGLGPARRQLLDAYRIARTLIAPMLEALKLYNKAADAISALGGDAIVDLPDINDYLKGQVKPIKHFSRKELTAQSAAFMRGLIESNRDNIELQQLASDKYGLYALEVRTGRISNEDARTAAMQDALLDYANMSDSPGAALVREEIAKFKNSYNTSGLSDQALREFNTTINMGLLLGIKDDSKLTTGPMSARLSLNSDARSAAEATRAAYNFNLEKLQLGQAYELDENKLPKLDANGNFVYKTDGEGNLTPAAKARKAADEGRVSSRGGSTPAKPPLSITFTDYDASGKAVGGSGTYVRGTDGTSYIQCKDGTLININQAILKYGMYDTENEKIVFKSGNSEDEKREISQISSILEALWNSWNLEQRGNFLKRFYNEDNPNNSIPEVDDAQNNRGSGLD